MEDDREYSPELGATVKKAYPHPNSIRRCAHCGTEEDSEFPLLWCDGKWYCPGMCEIADKDPK